MAGGRGFCSRDAQAFLIVVRHCRGDSRGLCGLKQVRPEWPSAVCCAPWGRTVDIGRCGFVDCEYFVGAVPVGGRALGKQTDASARCCITMAPDTPLHVLVLGSTVPQMITEWLFYWLHVDSNDVGLSAVSLRFGKLCSAFGIVPRWILGSLTWI